MNATADVKSLKMAEELSRHYPEVWRLCEPRRYACPAGYMNPRHYSLSLFSHWLCARDPRFNHVASAEGILCAMRQMSLGVPTYFVRPELAQAVAQTEPPLDFRLSEIRWPMEAMLLVLPDAFVQRYFKRYCPLISVVRCPSGLYPEMLEPKFRRLWSPQLVQNSGDKLICTFLAYGELEHDVPADYYFTNPLKISLGELAGAEVPFQDNTWIEEDLLLRHFGVKNPRQNGPATEQEEKELVVRVRNFVVRLLLCLTYKPDYVNHSSVCQRPAKIKKGRERDALWTPNFIGNNYRAARIQAATSAAGGGHSSPRMHWRRGHWANQAVNAGADNFISVNQMPLNERREIDWPNVSEELRQRFWQCHKRCWIEPVLVNADEAEPAL